MISPSPTRVLVTLCRYTSRKRAQPINLLIKVSFKMEIKSCVIQKGTNPTTRLTELNGNKSEHYTVQRLTCPTPTDSP